MKKLTFIGILIISHFAYGQNVGIGTNNPNNNALLELSSTSKALQIPRLTTAQMTGISNTGSNAGMIVYNSTEHQFYGHMRYRSTNIIGQATYRWQPIATGPQMIAWGVVDSFGAVKSGSENYSVTWDAVDNWYELIITSHPFYKDSMMLIVTPVGNGSWDQAVAIGELIDGSIRRATIKFTDVSRVAAGWTALASRRRSWFYFALYNLRKDPYNTLNP
jgi:hypothetical protein